jgi:superfamily II DNA or RNA helicase
MGVVERWERARTAMVVAECGTGKTLISLGAIHVHSDGHPYNALAMVPPHLVEKWAREAFLTIPGIRVFLIISAGAILGHITPRKRGAAAEEN